MKEYHVGDKVWWASLRTEEVRVECPVCFGKLEVTLILGNDEAVVLPCDYCGKGYEGPKGYIIEHHRKSSPKECTIEEVRSEETAKGRVVEYLSNHFLLKAEDVFDTEEEAAERAKEKASAEEQYRIESELKKTKSHNYSWSAGYHRKEANECRRRAEGHDMLAKICKERARPKIAALQKEE